MKTNPSRTNSMIPVVALMAALMPLPAAQAAATPQQRYQQDVAACMKLPADQRSNCLSEASTRLAQTKPTPPSEAPSVLAANALKRCQPLPTELKEDCVARMRGEGTVTGSVEGGGIYRELVTTVTEPQDGTASTSGSASAPR